MDRNLKQYLSNVMFSMCAMGIFLAARRQVFLANAFRTKLSPLCFNLIKFQTQTNIASSSVYLKRLAAYAVLQAGVMGGIHVLEGMVGKENGQRQGNGRQFVYEINFSKLFNGNNSSQRQPQINTQQQQLQKQGKEQGYKYKINPTRIINPILFCTVFKLPISLGISLGVIGNHIDSNILDKFVEMLN